MPIGVFGVGGRVFTIKADSDSRFRKGTVVFGNRYALPFLGGSEIIDVFERFAGLKRVFLDLGNALRQGHAFQFG